MFILRILGISCDFNVCDFWKKIYKELRYQARKLSSQNHVCCENLESLLTCLNDHIYIYHKNPISGEKTRIIPLRTLKTVCNTSKKEVELVYRLDGRKQDTTVVSQVDGARRFCSEVKELQQFATSLRSRVLEIAADIEQMMA